ncbi:MAG: UPF0182 family protein [Gemmatimonadaceae bacterium]|nr:UPF0182 family protein [Gemmatimonadaceae bacterium]MCW5825156.1 UPF0182 family protein [Gemmatimonadaceae bacterium]
MRGRRSLLGFLAGGALALLAGRAVAGIYADWAFHQALGFGELWELKAATVLALRSGALVAATLFAFANLYAVRHSIVSLVLPSQLGDLEIPEAVPTQRLTLVAALLALLVGSLFALLPMDWHQAALAWEGVRFGEIDPYLEHDLGFYVAWLPWERALQARLMSLTIVVAALVTLLYAATPSIRWTASGLYVSTWVRRHLSVLGGLAVALIGWGWRLDRFERLSPGSGVWLDATTEAVFTSFDHRIALPYRAFAAFATLPLAAVLVYAGWRGYLRSAVAMLGMLIALGPIASALLPAVAKRPLNSAEGRQQQRPYRNTSALFTRRAFGVDQIATARASLGVVPASRVSRSVSAWDPAALEALSADGQRRDSVVAIGWHGGRDGLEALALLRPRSPRDGDWHAARYLAPSADDAGRPFHAPSLGDGRLPEVLIHPGAARVALISDLRGDLAGAPFETTWQRIALAWAEQDPRLLARDAPSPRPELVTARDVLRRVAAVVPFLEAGPTIQPYVRVDSLYWFVELFSTATRYPLSESVTFNGREWRYVQHAATAVVQAQTGQVTIIPVERPDPVLRVWLERAGSTFTPLAAAPDWMRRERPPVVDWMVVQGSALARVGFQGDTLGARRLTRPDDADADLAVGGPTPFQLDSSGALGWALPVDIPWAGRTLGVLVARGGTERRSEFHEDARPRWTTILERLQGAADEAGFGRTLPNVRRGRVQSIPTADGALWVQSYYEWPRDGVPRLAGVVVSSRAQTVAARTLGEALGERRPPTRLDGDAFRARVSRLYDAMQAAQRSGDWRAYGEAWTALGRLLERP